MISGGVFVVSELNDLVSLFYKHKRYLTGVSENTIYFYSVCFKAGASDVLDSATL
jgi:hypothetical protein